MEEKIETAEMEEITNPAPQEEVVEEIPVIQPEDIIEVRDPGEVYVPVEFAYIDYERSWKKCKCGRITGLRDRFCPSCGRKLGIPLPNDD